MIIGLTAAHQDAFDRAATAMIQTAFALDVDNASAALILKDRLSHLHRSLSDNLASVFQRFGANDKGPSEVTDKFDGRTDSRIDELVDDFLHGMLNGQRMTKGDPIVAVMVNSPGATQQAGHHNRQTVSHADRHTVDAAITAFLASAEVARLSVEQQVSLKDTADVLSEAVASPSPDDGKIKRWGGRLLQAARDLGVDVAASGISKALFG